MLIIGLTGNYGMGKSTVLEMFREFGAVTLEADEVVDALLNDKSVLEKIRMTLGDSVFLSEGSLDRLKVALIIFRDKRKMDAIEEILHPLVFKRIEDFIERVKRDIGMVVVVEIPLMFEREYFKRFHKTITVCADQEITLRRLEKSGITRDDALIRLSAQMPIEEKMLLSDFVINNNGTLNETREQVREIYDRLMQDRGEG